MNTRRFPNILLAGLLAIGLFTACKEDDPIDPDNTPVQPETSITFTCKDSIGIEGVFVGIAIQQADCDAGIFLRSGDSDWEGKVKFASLAPATYCYQALRTTVGGVVERTGSVDLQQDERAKVVLTF